MRENPLGTKFAGHVSNKRLRGGAPSGRLIPIVNFSSLLHEQLTTRIANLYEGLPQAADRHAAYVPPLVPIRAVISLFGS
jgi:hypothetical protein